MEYCAALLTNLRIENCTGTTGSLRNICYINCICKLISGRWFEGPAPWWIPPLWSRPRAPRRVPPPAPILTPGGRVPAPLPRGDGGLQADLLLPALGCAHLEVLPLRLPASKVCRYFKRSSNLVYFWKAATRIVFFLVAGHHRSLTLPMAGFLSGCPQTSPNFFKHTIFFKGGLGFEFSLSLFNFCIWQTTPAPGISNCYPRNL